MSVDDLIKEGEAARKTCLKQGMVEEFISGEDFEKWIAKGILFMEDYQTRPLYERFILASRDTAQNSLRSYDTMMGILKAIQEYDS